MISSNDVDIESLLKKIYDDKIKIEHDKEEIEKNLNQIEVLKKNLQRDDSKVKAKEKEIIDNAKIEARQILLDAKDEATSLISQMNKVAESSDKINELNNIRNKLNDSVKQKNITNNNNLSTVNAIDRSLIVPNTKVYVTTLAVLVKVKWVLL